MSFEEYLSRKPTAWLLEMLDINRRLAEIREALGEPLGGEPQRIELIRAELRRRGSEPD